MTSATYTYSGAGLRVSKTVNGTTSAEVWDGSGGLPLLLQDGSTDYVYGPGGLPLEQITGSTTLWLHHDRQGSTRLITGSTGAVMATWTYDPYGNTAAHVGTATAQMLYAGQYQDAESGLYYLRARYYDPATGQFLSRDPAVAVTRSPYSYVGGNPLNATDPSGLYPGRPPDYIPCPPPPLPPRPTMNPTAPPSPQPGPAPVPSASQATPGSQACPIGLAVGGSLGFAGFGELFIGAVGAPFSFGASLAIAAGLAGMTASGVAIAGATGHGPLAC